MPYTVLDAIERYAIRDKLMPVEVWQEVRNAVADQYDANQLGQWVETILSALVPESVEA